MFAISQLLGAGGDVAGAAIQIYQALSPDNLGLSGLDLAGAELS